MRVRTVWRLGTVTAAVALIGLLAACGQATGTPEASAPSASEPSAPEHPTLQTLIDMELEPATLELGEEIESNEEFTTTAVTYTSGSLSVTGALSVPVDDGPHPGLVLVHGVVDPEVYQPGSGLIREQAYFAKAGYVVLSTDLRNSTAAPDSAAALGVDLGSTRDVINAVRSLYASAMPELDASRIAILGHSLGGLLTLNTMVARPELVDAAAVVAPASIKPSKNIDYLTTMFGGTPAHIIEEYGTPESNSEFWKAISPRGFVDRVEAPLLIEHGTDDQVIPYAWSEETAAVWRDAGKQVELVTLEGEGHVVQEQWADAMRLADEFFDRELAG